MSYDLLGGICNHFHLVNLDIFCKTQVIADFEPYWGEAEWEQFFLFYQLNNCIYQDKEGSQPRNKPLVEVAGQYYAYQKRKMDMETV